MANKELKKLKRAELLAILVEQNREIEQLQQELEAVKQQLASREIAIAEAGSIAEAALNLNGVFSAAQAACSQYIDNMKQRSEQQERLCADMERETKEKCARMVLDAQKAANAHWEQANQKIKQVLQDSEDLKKLLSL